MSDVPGRAHLRSLREQVKRGMGSVNCLMFRNGAELFAIPLDRVIEARDSVTVLPVPDLPQGIIGVVGAAGRTIQVVDGSEFLGVATSERNPSILMFGSTGESAADAGSGAPVVALAVDQLLSSVVFELTQVQRVVAFEDRGGAFAGVIIHDGMLVTLLDSDSFVTSHSEANVDHPGLH